MQSRRVSSLNMLVGEEVHLLSRQLYCAAARGHVRTLRKILLSGVDPDWYHPDDGLTCLQVAALEGRANCVHHLLLAGADMYATLSQGCTAIDFFVQQKLLVHILDKLFWTRNYKGCLECLEKADADCQRRFHATTEYQGIVVIHPSDQLGLVCLPAGTALVCAGGRPACTDDSPAAQRAARPALAVALPLDEDELRRWEHTRRVVASRSLGHHDPDRPLSPRFPRSFIGDVSKKRTHVHAYRLGE